MIARKMGMIALVACLAGLWSCGDDDGGRVDCNTCPDEGTRTGCLNAYAGCENIPNDAGRDACIDGVTAQFRGAGCS